MPNTLRHERLGGRVPLKAEKVELVQTHPFWKC